MSHRILSSVPWLVFLLSANAAGFVYGLVYYQSQLHELPSYAWLFVIDSPLYVFLVVLISLLLLAKKRVPSWLYYVTSVGLVKVGVWTVLVVGGLHFGYYFSADPYLNTFIVATHVGMVLEGIVLIPRIAAQKKECAGVLAWFLVNDYLDYFHGTLTTIPITFVCMLVFEAVAATLVVTVGIYALRRKNR